MNELEAVQPIHRGTFSRILNGIWTKTLVRAILFGILSISAYLLVFMNEGTITEHFSRGGTYTFAVLATAIGFSLIHGTFANYVLELIGIRAKDSH